MIILAWLLVEYFAVALKLVRDSSHIDSMVELITCGMLGRKIAAADIVSGLTLALEIAPVSAMQHFRN